ncbi:uncharacterized protein LOC143883018 [Tasmannia lanceolata]|uniref:uncharacterized protein LOC143883018 n=1 Tax=Tasmannia lanceolata TaxID=3420 RepID=UPI004064209D
MLVHYEDNFLEFKRFGVSGGKIQLKELIRSSKPDLICIQETKLEDISREIIRSCGVKADWDFSFVPSLGASGGILVAWDEVCWQSIEVWKGKGSFSISVALRRLEDESLWLFTGVYGPVQRADKEVFWSGLGRIRGLCSYPWCIGGDFNEIKSIGERVGCNRINQGMRSFANFIADNELIDLPLSGSAFIWSRGESRSRLDRFLIGAEWMAIVPDILQKALIHSVSYHSPILLDPRLESWGPTSFRFEIAWLNYPHMVERLGEWWSSYHVEGPADVIIGKKLKLLKKKIKVLVGEEKK